MVIEPSKKRTKKPPQLSLNDQKREKTTSMVIEPPRNIFRSEADQQLDRAISDTD